MKIKGLARINLTLGIATFGILILMGMVLAGTVALSDKSHTPSGSGSTTQYHDYGTWSYNANRDEEGLHVSISYDKNSLNKLESYVAANKRLAAEISAKGGQAEASITFRAPLPPEQFRRWAVENKLKTTYITVRSLEFTEGKYSRITGVVFVPKEETNPLPQSSLDSAVRGRLQGIFTVQGTLPAAQLLRIIDDPLVFLPDVTPTLVRQNLLSVQMEDAKDIAIRPPAPFWEMEDFGLVIYPTPLPPPVGTQTAPMAVPTGAPAITP